MLVFKAEADGNFISIGEIMSAMDEKIKTAPNDIFSFRGKHQCSYQISWLSLKSTNVSNGSGRKIITVIRIHCLRAYVGNFKAR